MEDFKGKVKNIEEQKPGVGRKVFIIKKEKSIK